MSANTLEKPEQVTSDILRYATDLPGQALSETETRAYFANLSGSIFELPAGDLGMARERVLAVLARPVAVAPYADQAAVWHALTQGKSETEVASLRRRVQRWHQQNPIDAPRVIRSIHNRLAS